MTITTPTSTRQLPAYQVISDPMEFALRGEANRAGELVAYGDRGQRPAPLEVEVTLQEASFRESLQLASRVIEEAGQATSVILPRGVRTVDGILDHTLRTDGPLVLVRFWFAPTGGDYS